MIPLIDKAILDIIKTPPAFPTDANRETASQALRSADYDVFVSSRPQGSKQLAITIERAGGNSDNRNLDAPTGRTQTLLDVTYWSKDTASNRGNVAGVLEMMHYVAVILPGLRADDYNGVNICDIVIESDPFAADQSPTDKSDGWTSNLTQSFLVFWRRLDSSHIIAEI